MMMMIVMMILSSVILLMMIVDISSTFHLGGELSTAPQLQLAYH
jgi:hypothetical protein